MRKSFKNIKDGLLTKRKSSNKQQLFSRNSDHSPEHKPEILFTEERTVRTKDNLFKKERKTSSKRKKSKPAASLFAKKDKPKQSLFAKNAANKAIVEEVTISVTDNNKSDKHWKPSRKEMGIVAAAVLALVVVPTIIIVGNRGGGTNASNTTDNPTMPVQAQQPAPTVTPEPSPTEKPLHPNDVVFSEGTEAPIVAEIQQRLMDLGYMDKDEPTQKYGPVTANAVKLFQRKHELTIDGEMGKETYAKLIADDAQKYSVGVGNEGTDVYELQIRLRELDYLDKATNYYGTETEQAVKKFQQLNGLEDDGTVGEMTREMLYGESAKANVLSQGEQSDDIKKLQDRLQQLGYLTSTPDGTYGDNTELAVKRFQERNSLIADGYMGQETRKTLLSEDANANGLALGMTGNDVEDIQELLVAHNYLNSADGHYGEITESAVKSFQKRNDLTADGKVGAETLNVLKSNDAVDAPPPPSPASNNNSSANNSGNGSSGNSSSGKQNSSGGGSKQNSSSSSSSSGSSSGGGESAPVPSGSGVEGFISIAQSRLGMKYVRGGKGPNTFDCSGFVYWCLNQAGVSQGYMTSATWQGVTKYKRIGSLGEVQRGDVISFKGHVGIALGGGQMIDASSSQGKIRIANLGSPYWSRNFVAAFRIF